MADRATACPHLPRPTPPRRAGGCCRLPLQVGCLLLLGGAVQGAPGWSVWTATGLVKVGQQAAPGERRELRLEAARGEVEWGQLVFRASEPASVQLTARPLQPSSGPSPCPIRLSFHPAVYVHVSTPSGNAARQPGYWPEVLPENDRVPLPAGTNQPVYVQVRVPPEVPAGVYRGSVLCRGGAETVAVPLRLTVWPLTLPRLPTVRTSYYIWWEGLQKRFGLKPGTPRWREVADRFFWFLVEHRLCPMSLPVDLREAAPYLDDARVNGVRLPYVGTDEELRSTMSLARRRGWLDRCFYYLYDEPSRRQWPEVWFTAKRLCSLDPGVPRLDTIQPEPELRGAVSIWCPNLESVYLHEDAVAAARARGEEVWWYTCCVPKYPYPTFLLDDDAIAPRLMFWSGPRYDLTGSLYINTIHWGPEGNDIWAEAAVSPELLANNDGLLMYTGRGTRLEDAFPVTGVRLEMIRDGLEDVELLNLLRGAILEAARQGGLASAPALARRHLQALASEVMPDLRHCDREPEHLLRLRRRVAAETVRLRNDPSCLQELLGHPVRTAETAAEALAPDKFALALPGTPALDGDLAEPPWERCAAANGPGSRTTITRFRNLTGRDWPAVETRVHWLYDAANLYCSFVCQEPEAGKLKLLPTTPAPAETDRVGVELVTTAGRQWCLVSADGSLFGGTPDSPAPVASPWWQARAELYGDGYCVELSFPRARLVPGHAPQFNLYRYCAPGRETLYFSGRFSTKTNPLELATLELRP